VSSTYLRETRSDLEKPMWDLWWTTRCCDSFCLRVCGFFLSQSMWIFLSQSMWISPTSDPVSYPILLVRFALDRVTRAQPSAVGFHPLAGRVKMFSLVGRATKYVGGSTLM
jgi:hypothetical protein